MGYCLGCGSSNLRAYVQTFSEALIIDLVNLDLVVGLATKNVAKIIAGSGGLLGAASFMVSGLETSPRGLCNDCESLFVACPHCGAVLAPDKAPKLGDKMQCGNCNRASVIG